MSYWRIVHNLLRQDDTPEEVERATEACVWLAENALNLRKVCSAQQIEILSYINTFWFNHKSAPSFQILKETIERKSASPGILEALSEYEEQEDLSIHSTKDLGQLLTDLVDEWQSERLKEVLKITRAINSSSWKDPKTKKVYQGAKDAAKYLLMQVEAGVVFTGQRTLSGALNDTAMEIKDLYDKLKADRIAGNLRIRTGIAEIDNVTSIKRGDFVGVLGYAGQRKSTLCRTMAYNAARMGFNVLHISLEQTYDEERIIYALMHSVDPKFGHHGLHLSKKEFDNGNMTEEQEKFLMNVVLPDLENLPGRLIIRQPTDGTLWSSIKAIAEVTNLTTPIDLFFIDYLALVSTVSVSDSKTEMELIIKDAKQTALQFDNGRGVVLLTPIQGNRKGFDEAEATGGQWDMRGVNMFSEFDKTLDLGLSTYIDKILEVENCMIVSSVKYRRGPALPLIKVPLDANVGMVGEFTAVPRTKDELIAILIDEL